MKIDNIKGNLEGEAIGSSRKTSASIDEKNLGIALKLLSKNLYSNPIGTFIRELTTNAVDTHIELGKTEPIIVKFYELRPGEWYLDIIDKGTGMNLDFWETKFMSYFDSTKRKDNTRHGGWGLGGKSGLSYVESHPFITRQNGTEWCHLLIDGKDEPESELLYETPTDEEDGTIARIPIKRDDLFKVSREIENQLAYFESVYVINEHLYYDNDYKFYEYDDFIFSTKSPHNTLHIVLGQIYYPINWDKLGLDPINIPVGLKFEIGELPVTLSRESIDYRKEKVETLLKEKIDKVLQYFTKLFSEEFTFNDIIEYGDFVYGSRKRTVDFHGRSVTFDKRVFNDVNIGFKPLKDVKISKDKFYNLFALYDDTFISNGTVKTTQSIFRNSFDSYRSCYINTGNLNKWDSLYVDEATVFTRRKVTRDRIERICKALNLLDNDGNPVEGYLKYVNIAIKEVDKAVRRYCNNDEYFGIASASWIEQKKEEQREDYQRRKEVISYYQADFDYKRSKIKIGDLVETYKLVFYVDLKGDIERIFALYALYLGLPYHFKVKSKFIFVATTTIGKIKKYKNCLDAETLLKTKVVKGMYNKMRYTDKFMPIISSLSYLSIEKYSPYYSKILRKISNRATISYKYSNRVRDYSQESIDGQSYVNKTIDINLLDYFKEELEEISFKELEYEEKYEELKVLSQKLEPVKYLDYNAPDWMVYRVLKGRNIKHLNPKFYKDEQN